MAGMSVPSSLADHFLIAMPSLADPNFARGVTLICQHDENGAMGLVVNRVSEYTYGDILSQLDIPLESADLAGQPVLLGGPVQPERGFVLYDDPRDWGASLRIGPSLALSTSRDILAAMARGAGPARALLALGYAGWTAGQLEAELIENSWLTVRAEPAILFDTPLEERWRAAARSLGVDLSHLADGVGHA